MENKKKRQHYVPQVYLRSFSDDEKHINVFDKVEKGSFSSAILDVAKDNYFYDFPKFDRNQIIALQPNITDKQLDDIEKAYEHFGEEQATENRLSLIEDNYSVILKKILKQNEPIKISSELKENKEEISKFIAIQITRTKRFRNFIECIEKKTSNEQKLPKESAIIQTMILYNSTILKIIINNILNRYWVAGINSTEELLYTSDNPVVWDSKKTSDIEFINSFEKSEIIAYPLSDKIILLMYKGKHKEYMKLNKGLIKRFNRLQIKCSSRQIYSRNKDFKIGDKYLK